MPKMGSKANITTAAQQLRAMIWAIDDGDLVGSEEFLTDTLSISRPTLRQVARLLESEGLLKVRRGINGGYFSARPSVEVIEASVSAYMQMVEADDEELSEIATFLWVIIIRKAAKLPKGSTVKLVKSLRSKIQALKDDAILLDIVKIEEESRAEIFKLINSPYLELIFHLNRTSAVRHFTHSASARDATPEHFEFVQAWRKAKMLELETLSGGDVGLAELAARHTRNLFHTRLWGRSGT